MSEKPADPTAAYQVELAISRLDSLSSLPSVAVRLLSELLQSQPSHSALAEIIESDPALIAKLLSLMHQQGLNFRDENFSVHRALDKLPAQLVRDGFLSIKAVAAFDFDPDSYKALPKKQLVLHCLAVACCAGDIAGIISPPIDPQLAYLAGLLHDIGKLALAQAMPKSFARIAEEAKSQNVCTRTIEQSHLGLDHTILGKRLAQKWHLPDEITLAIWLHHNDTAAISQDMPEARIAQVVQLADLTARQCAIGQSASYDSPDLPDEIMQSLAINPQRLQQIRSKLTEQVRQKSKVLALDSPRPEAAYCEAIHSAAAQLAKDNTKLSLENRRLQTDTSHFNFIRDFWLSIDSTVSPIGAAENFACRWQKFYQTGAVCVYLAPPAGSQLLEAVVVENLSQSKIVCLNTPADSAPIPKHIANSFAILNAHDHINWLFEQLDVDFDLNHTKLVPLLSAGKAIGAIAFELRYPADLELFEERFKVAGSIAGAVLDMVCSSANQQRFAERFAHLLTPHQNRARQNVSKVNNNSNINKPDFAAGLTALAELAAGAAHELNNPLSVISAKSQLLTDAETDPEKKQALKQIQENSNEITSVIDDLMAFAEPTRPRPTLTNTREILDEATQLAVRKTNIEHLDVQIDVADNVADVFADSAQVVSAIANIFCNCVESYPQSESRISTDEPGPIKVTAANDEAGDFVKLQISDLGCGMDAETVRKATLPFFSAKPAGRKRGMGLAYAGRVIELNKGRLSITSQPGEGTTVTILLRRA